MSARGATYNQPSSRFGLAQPLADGDWLDERVLLDGGAPPLRTNVTLERAKSIISRNQSPDVPFDRSVNPYRGCEHGCIYCFARPTHAYHDLSPGLDFESRLFAKPHAARLLREALAKPGYAPAPLAMGTNTDPYQPIEGRYRITRQVIEVLSETRHPLMITTKSDRILRDIDILAPMAADGLFAAMLSVTTLQGGIARTLEPRAAAPHRRIAAIRKLTEAGVPVHASISPVIPHITDREMEAIIDAVADAGARAVFFMPVRLPHEVAPLFRAWLDKHYPERAAKVMATIQSLRGGRDNDPRFFTRMQGEGPWADLMATRFRIALAKRGLTRNRVSLRSDLFEPPGRNGQLRLL